MIDLAIIGLMVASALLPFVWMTLAMRGGKSGLVLTVNSLIGAGLAILWFASGRPMGIDPVTAMSVALLGFVPALLGSLSGTVLGWLLRRRDDRVI